MVEFILKLMLDHKTRFLSTNTWYFRIKKGKATDYVLSWKSKAVFHFKLKPSYTAFFQYVKISEYRIEINFSKIWPRNLTSNLKFKNCMFATTSIVKNSDEYVYSGYGITFDSASS